MKKKEHFISTAEEFMTDAYQIKHYGTILMKPTQSAIEFAKLHVEAALKEISEKAFAESSRSNMTSRGSLTCIHLGEVSINKESIINAYPLTNIK